MAIFNGHVITDAGRNLLGRALAGEGRIILTRGAFGAGKYTGNIRELTKLLDERLTANIASAFNDRGTLNVKVQITNKELEYSFRTEEFGIYAKIEGDSEEVLYTYCTAIEADTIPNNSFGDTFLAEHVVLIAFSSEPEAEIYVKESAVFLSLETANQLYTTTGLAVEGRLSSGRTTLKANYQYQADNGKWYKNIGGNRSWISGKGTPDDLLIEISYNYLQENKVDKTTRINVQNGLMGGGNLSENLEIRIDNLSDDEVDMLLNFEEFEDLITLATESDIRNLFVGTSLSGGQSYNLSQLSTDEQKIVNMRLLSLFNDLLLQKLKNSETSLTDLINTKANNTITITAGKGLDGGGNLNNSITLNIVSKNDGIIVNENDIQLNIVDNLEDSSSTRAASSRIVKKVNDEKVDKTTQIIVGEGLLGTGTLNKNLNITLDVLSDSDIDELLGDI